MVCLCVLCVCGGGAGNNKKYVGEMPSCVQGNCCDGVGE